ncbi:MAG: WXG100 family type VII secretion target [Chloroflexi bacterium CFX4]|nr:WXG100 family type VII secretion target [Chloroflexi bacterium CFX4]MDL1924097.1 WXG100 family type VII secretion target [Chloroflexi bacterium CFX3]
MGAPKIQADYSSLEQISANFSKESDQTRQLLQTVKSCVDALKGGGWIGKGADNFYKEMEELVNPAMDRMMRALADAASATKRVADALRQAEEEGCALFG